MKTYTFLVEGMTCAVCSTLVERALKKIPSSKDVSVNLATKKATITVDEEYADFLMIVKVIEKEGFSVNENINYYDEELKYKKEKKKKLFQLIIGCYIAALLLIISMFPMIGLPSLINIDKHPDIYALFQLILALLAMAVGYKFYIKGFKNLARFRPNMDSLVALSTSVSFIYSVYHTIMIFRGHHHYAHHLYFESVGVVLALIMLGKYLEMNSINKTREALKGLYQLTPERAIKIIDDQEIEVSVGDINIDDLLVCKPGQKIAVDGIVTEGKSSIDEASLNGESIPVDKVKGSKVYAGTINQEGVLYYKAARVGRDTLVSQIVKMVESSQGSKAKIARVADKVSLIFTPLIMLISLGSFIAWMIISKDFNFSINILVSVLVIACPCALGLATPVAIITSTGVGAKHGVLFKNAEAIEKGAQIKYVAFDKTGTLTKGKPIVCEVINFDRHRPIDVLQMTASLEKQSSHPLASAIVNKAILDNVTLRKVNEFETLVGFGLKGNVEGYEIVVAKPDYFNLDFNQLEIVNNQLNLGRTVAIVQIAGQLAGLISLEDELKEDAIVSVKKLKDMGLIPVMLTGDHEKVARAIADKVGIGMVYSSLLPQDKVKIINELKEQGLVAMVGDGMNDAPSLVNADLGIGIGNGTDIALNSSNVVLMSDKLSYVVKLFKLCKSSIRNIKENLFWAFLYNSIAIPIACGVFSSFGLLLTPMIGALAMSFSSLCVVLNALRLNLFKGE